MLVLAQVSSMNTRREGSSRPWYFRHCARRRATSGRSCSLACRLFFEGNALVHEEVPNREVAHLDAACRKLRPDRPQRQVGLLGQAGQKPFPLRSQRIGPPAADLAAAALPVARKRCDHFTTLATLTWKVAATARQLPPAATAATTRSRRSRE